MILIPSKYYDKKPKYKDYNEIKNYEENEEEGIIKHIICNLPYILITLYRGNRLFVYISINFWLSDYLQNTFRENNPSIIFWSYSITMVISIICGIILGGIIINQIGGTKSKNIFVSMAILQFIAVFFGILSPLSNSVLEFSTLMSLYMLFNSACGIISISASFAVMPKNLIGTATGIYSIIVNLIAFLPAPYVYAFIKNFFQDESYIIITLMIYSFLGDLELIIADIYMRVKKIKIHKESEQKL